MGKFVLEDAVNIDVKILSVELVPNATHLQESVFVKQILLEIQHFFACHLLRSQCVCQLVVKMLIASTERFQLSASVIQTPLAILTKHADPKARALALILTVAMELSVERDSIPFRNASAHLVLLETHSFSVMISMNVPTAELVAMEPSASTHPVTTTASVNQTQLAIHLLCVHQSVELYAQIRIVASVDQTHRAREASPASPVSAGISAII